jgi:hypothetical protein
LAPCGFSPDDPAQVKNLTITPGVGKCELTGKQEKMAI